MKKKGFSVYIKYSSIGIQIVIFILILTWVGIRLDQWLAMERPWCTIVFALGACLSAMVYMILKLR